MWYHIGKLIFPRKSQFDKENEKMTKVTEQARFGGGRKLAALLAAGMLALGTNAATWTCYPEITDGMTGAQQVTNAFTDRKSVV